MIIYDGNNFLSAEKIAASTAEVGACANFKNWFSQFLCSFLFVEPTAYHYMYYQYDHLPLLSLKASMKEGGVGAY